jgi:hypothetical protein
MSCKYVIPPNYITSIMIKEELCLEDKAFQFIEHMQSFDQAIITKTPADQPLLCEYSRSVLSILWIITTNKKKLLSNLVY